MCSYSEISTITTVSKGYSQFSLQKEVDNQTPFFISIENRLELFVLADIKEENFQGQTSRELCKWLDARACGIAPSRLVHLIPKEGQVPGVKPISSKPLYISDHDEENFYVYPSTRVGEGTQLWVADKKMVEQFGLNQSLIGEEVTLSIEEKFKVLPSQNVEHSAILSAAPSIIKLSQISPFLDATERLFFGIVGAVTLNKVTLRKRSSPEELLWTKGIVEILDMTVFVAERKMGDFWCIYRPVYVASKDKYMYQQNHAYCRDDPDVEQAPFLLGEVEVKVKDPLLGTEIAICVEKKQS